MSGSRQSQAPCVSAHHSRGLYHERGDIHAARDVALEDGVAHMPAPHRQALALTLLKVAPTHDRPPGVAGKHPPAGFTQADDRIPEWMQQEPLAPRNVVFDVPEEDLDSVFNNFISSKTKKWSWLN